jgi:hypothetical protein
MPLGSNGRWREGVIRLPDCSLGPLVSKLGVVTTGKLKDSSVDIGSLLVSLESLPDSMRTYVLGGQDTDEGCDKVGSETLEHLWRHGSSQHSSSSKLHVSCDRAKSDKLTGTMTLTLMSYFVPSRASVRVRPIRPTDSQHSDHQDNSLLAAE